MCLILYLSVSSKTTCLEYEFMAALKFVDEIFKIRIFIFMDSFAVVSALPFPKRPVWPGTVQKVLFFLLQMRLILFINLSIKGLFMFLGEVSTANESEKT